MPAQDPNSGSDLAKSLPPTDIPPPHTQRQSRACTPFSLSSQNGMPRAPRVSPVGVRGGMRVLRRVGFTCWKQSWRLSRETHAQPWPLAGVLPQAGLSRKGVRQGWGTRSPNKLWGPSSLLSMSIFHAPESSHPPPESTEPNVSYTGWATKLCRRVSSNVIPCHFCLCTGEAHEAFLQEETPGSVPRVG